MARQTLARLHEAKWRAYGTKQLCLVSCLDLGCALSLVAIAAMRCSRCDGRALNRMPYQLP